MPLFINLVSKSDCSFGDRFTMRTHSWPYIVVPIPEELYHQPDSLVPEHYAWLFFLKLDYLTMGWS